MLSSHLFHFAMVHEKFAQTGDIVTGLLPLFSPILEGKEGLEFDPMSFCDDVRNMYGIEMHPYVAEDLSNKLVDNGILEIEKSRGRSEKIVIATVPIVQDKDLKSNVQSILEKYESFSKPLLEKRGLMSSSINFSKAFTSRLARVDSFAEVVSSSKDSVNCALDYTFVRFVEHINRKGGKLKTSLDKLYSGSLLSEVVLSIQDPTMDEKSITGKLFYIDMPVLLNILGLNDEYSVECSRKLISLISAQGGVVTTTRQYIEEAEIAISLSLENYKQRGKRTTSLDRYLFKHSDHVLQTRLTRNKVKKLLSDRHQFVLDDLRTNISGYLQSVRAIDLRDSIVSALHWYKKDVARTNDADAVAYVVARHDYNSIRNVAESSTFLITPNELLISAANRVLYSLDTFENHEMTPLLTEKKLAMMLWVTSGGKGEDVSSLTLISSCTRAMEMHRDASENMQRFIKSLPEEKVKQYEDVICNDRALYCLLDEVNFDDSEVPLDEAEQYLQQARDRFQQEQKDFKVSQKAVIDEATFAAANAIEHRNKAISAVKEKANESLVKDKKNAALQDKVQSLTEQFEEKEQLQKQLAAVNDKLENRVNALEVAQQEANKASNEKISQLEKERVEQLKEGKHEVKDQVYSFIKKFLELCIVGLLMIAFYNLSTLALDEPITNQYFTFTPKLISFLTTILPLICTWKFPDFLFGWFVKWFSTKLVRLLLGDREFLPTEG
ncbi:hypothetical protein Q8W41_19550 [Vibrio splendidus]|uniref:hypothetical protein n=1 Tax=Vibrio TaxID=662 RepID=UPI002733AFC5|nr:hypothetical protein [Vibrio splendidus]MDP2591692.1 hypothetical protein [Vibrio splendidus]